MLGRRHDYHVSPFASTPHRSSPGYAHSPPSPWSYEGFRKPENEKFYTIKLLILLALSYLSCRRKTSSIHRLDPGDRGVSRSHDLVMYLAAAGVSPGYITPVLSC